MQFRLSTLLLLFVVLWSSLAVFGSLGIIVFAFFVALAVGIARQALLVVLASMGLLMLVAAVLLPAVSCAREAARRITCNCQVKQLGLALRNYHEKFGSFPPAYIADKNGRPMHSWRVLILPFIEGGSLCKKYSFTEPWDGPNNKKLLAARPYGFACPSDRAARDSDATCTSYVAVVGRNAAWTGEKSKKREELAPTDATVMLVEVTDVDIPWTEPRDLDLDSLRTSRSKVIPSSHHEPSDEFFHYPPPAGTHVAMADGSVKFLDGDLLKSKRLADLLTVGGLCEQNVDKFAAAPSLRIHWPNCLALAVWLISIGLLMLRALRCRMQFAAELAVQKTESSATDGHR